MSEHNTSGSAQKWYDSGHASLCVLGGICDRAASLSCWRTACGCREVLKYTPIQKPDALRRPVSWHQSGVAYEYGRGRVDVALTTAFGLPGCAEQSVIADTLDASHRRMSRMPGGSYC